MWTTLPGRGRRQWNEGVETEHANDFKLLGYKGCLKGTYVLCRGILLNINSEGPELKGDCQI